MTDVNNCVLLAPLSSEILEGVPGLISKQLSSHLYIQRIQKHCNSDFGNNFICLTKQRDRKCVHPVKHKDKKLNYHTKKRLGLYSLNRKGIAYKQLEELNKMWIEYMTTLLNIKHLNNNRYSNCPTDKNFEPISLKLYRADYHGCEMTVTKSSCPSLVGINGIVAMESKNCFRIIGKDDTCRLVPKEPCEFQFFLNGFKFILLGKNFVVRPAERSVKKIKLVKADI